MNAVKHSEISVKRWGGRIEDYYNLHNFMDSTKELCSDNRHRILHTMWGIKRIVIPIFGHTLVNSDRKQINVKDLLERDHILADFRNRFIPTLKDFVDAIDENALPLKYKQKIEMMHQKYKSNAKISELLLSPLAQTGKMSSLLITHNSWFINCVLPKIHNIPLLLKDIDLCPADFFNAMQFEMWMDNGADLPPSAKRSQPKLATIF